MVIRLSRFKARNFGGRQMIVVSSKQLEFFFFYVYTMYHFSLIDFGDSGQFLSGDSNKRLSGVIFLVVSPVSVAILVLLLVTCITLTAGKEDEAVLTLPHFVRIVDFWFMLFLVASVSLLRKKLEATDCAGPSLAFVRLSGPIAIALRVRAHVIIVLRLVLFLVA